MALSSVFGPPTYSTATTVVDCRQLNLTASLPTIQQTHQNIIPAAVSTTTTLTTLTSSSNVHKWKTHVSFFPAFFNLNKPKDPEPIKQELLDAIAPLDRGADATPEDQGNIDQIARKLEVLNPTKKPLESNLLDGKWELIYTTSQSILQTKRPKLLRSRKNYQGINVDTLRAQNMESFPFFNQVTADLTPINSKKVVVKFDYFKIGGLIPVKAPDTARGELEITYLDEDLRVSRGDKGNLFVLKMVDPNYRVPTTG